VESDDLVQLSHEFAELGRDLHGPGDDQAALQRMVQLAVRHLEPCTGASITEIRDGHGHSLATSDPVAARADQLQYDLDEGPCVRSAKLDTNYLLFDVATDTRWPRYCAALMEHTPYRSVLSMQLEAEEAAALNLFADQPGAFDDADVDTAAVLAAHISTLVALHDVRHEAAHLQTALQTNRQIGAAIGVLMAHHKITEPEAFALLRTTSQTLHRKLRDIAADVVETGTLPDQPAHPHGAGT
jgi:ANTAR domain-containing protein/GAF domain-containing protein